MTIHYDALTKPENVRINQYIGLQLDESATVTWWCPNSHAVQWLSGETKITLLKVGKSVACLTCGWIEP